MHKWKIPGLLAGLWMAFCAIAWLPLQAQNCLRTSTDEPAITHHQIAIEGKVLHYTARAGFLSIRDEQRVGHARIFYISYTLEEAPNSAPRPVTFVWGGGPGSASSMLNLGAVGPRRTMDMADYKTPPPPYHLVDNDATWLRFTNLVLMDPVGTGYSYATSPAYEAEFLGVRGDIDATAEFIRLYLNHYQLMGSPVFIAGESYGTFRAAGVARLLQKREIPLNGIILMSVILDLRLEASSPENDLQHVLILPNFSAAAFAHKKLSPELQANLKQTMQQVQDFAESDYLDALTKGDTLSVHDKHTISEQLAKYTGVDAATWEKANLRLSVDDFARDLLADEMEFVGHYDTTITGKLHKKDEPYNVASDPSLSGNGVPQLIYGYIRNELNFKSDAFYAGPFGGRWPSPSSPRADWMSVRWNWGGKGNTTDQSIALAQAVQSNPALKVFIASGYYDLSTPWLASEFTVDHMDLPPKLQSNFEFKRYKGGHMMYEHPKVRAQLANDVEAFIQSTLDHPKN